jgi:ubiquitin
MRVVLRMSELRPLGITLRRVVALGGGLAVFAAVAVFTLGTTSAGPATAAGVCKPAPAYLATTAGETIGGIGGTGRSGTGGDGGIGGTGIVGTITGFASICVNGVEVHYDDKVPVSENGRASTVGVLAVGQVVALEAGPGRLGLTAKRIEVIHALEGPVTKNEAGRLEVMGAIVMPADAALRGSIEPLKAGQWVQVNGHRDESGRWVATRVVSIEARREATVLGAAEAADRIGGVPVAGVAAGNLGDTRLLRGEWKTGGEDGGGRLRVRETLVAPASAMLSRADRVIVEIRVREVKDGRVRTGHPEIDSALAGRDLRAGELVRVRAVREANGQVRAERIERSAYRDTAGRSDGRQRDDATRSDRDGERDKEKAERDGNRGDSNRSETGRPESSDRGKQEKPERMEKNERNDRTDRIDKTERLERSEKSDRVERSDRVDRTNGDRVDRVERVETRSEKKIRD